MLDRQDIDALLVGALYGELSPAENTRLEAHLAAHPQDRLVLDGMSRTRDAIRDSHVLALQAEPPAAVSALLLQEAARRAPAAPREARAGWFAGFIASFTRVMRHPAMAAAAVIVLVVGIGGVLYVRGKATEDTGMEKAATEAVPTPPAAAGPERGRALEGLDQAPADDPAQAQAIGNSANAGSGAGSALEEVGTAELADRETKGGETTKQEKDALRKTTGKGGKKASEDKLKLSRPGYVEVTTPEPTIKDSDSYKAADKAADEGALNLRDQRGDSAQSRTSTGGLSAPPPPPAATPAAPQKKAGTKAPGPSGGGAAPTSPAADRAESNRLAAAQAQHREVVKAVAANNCVKAAQAAAFLAERYPDYYVENVRDDRSVAKCRAYIDKEVKKRIDAQQKSRAKNTQYDMESPSPKSE